MVHFTAVLSSITAERSAEVFVDTVFRLHGMPSELISDRDIRFTATFWQHVFSILGTRLRMSTADHPQTDWSERGCESHTQGNVAVLCTLQTIQLEQTLVQG